MKQILIKGCTSCGRCTLITYTNGGFRLTCNRENNRAQVVMEGMVGQVIPEDYTPSDCPFENAPSIPEYEDLYIYLNGETFGFKVAKGVSSYFKKEYGVRFISEKKRGRPRKV